MRRVVADAYVTSDSGTGVVHQSPAFGEDDMRVCLANGAPCRQGPEPAQRLQEQSCALPPCL